LASPDLDLGAAERKRESRRVKLEREIEAIERKLGNAGFLEKAPADVVQKARDELERLQAEREALR
jgi:valyl-tRNA synthetase